MIDKNANKFILTSQIKHWNATQNFSRLQLSINKWEKEHGNQAIGEIMTKWKKRTPAKEVKRIKKEQKKAVSDISSLVNSDEDDYGFFDDDIPSDKKKKKVVKKGFK